MDIQNCIDTFVKDNLSVSIIIDEKRCVIKVQRQWKILKNGRYGMETINKYFWQIFAVLAFYLKSH